MNLQRIQSGLLVLTAITSFGLTHLIRIADVNELNLSFDSVGQEEQQLRTFDRPIELQRSRCQRYRLRRQRRYLLHQRLHLRRHWIKFVPLKFN